jgi:hypothetical protein
MKAAEMLSATAELVSGQRAVDYGDKLANHQRIQKLWEMWFEERSVMLEQVDGKFLVGKESTIPSHLTAYDVAMMMLLVKIARLMNSPGHQDSHIDIAGYASILEEIANG